jgi:hypothetical protein
MTEQIDDDEIPDRIGATISKLARSSVADPVRTEKRPHIQQVA